MTIEKAVENLMKEWRVGDTYRPFFEGVVRDYMGDAHNVLESDMTNLRKIINGIK